MLHNRHKTNYYQNYHLKSFQQSPIYAPSQLDSDRSPDPFLYPTSLQQKITSKIPRFINLKIQVTNLLAKLKQWLIELCLTQNCVAEVNEQLWPIIGQIIEVGQQDSESYWMQTLNYPKISQNQLKQSQKVFVGSEVSDNDKHCSVLMMDSRAQVALLGENQKNLVKLYFKRYYRLLENCLSRINRCSGQKKLKFLVETAVKNIFTETLRVSYDLKLVEHRLKEQKQYRISINRNAYVRLMSNRIKMIFQDRGNLGEAFRLMKHDYYQGLKRDGIFVNGMLKNMDKLCSIYDRNRKWALTKKFYNWREISSQQKYREEFLILGSIHSTISNILPSIAPVSQSREQFSYQWRRSIELGVNLLLQTMFSGQNCVFVSLQQIMKQPRFQRNISIIQFLQERELSGAFTHRSGIYRDNPFLGEFTCQQLKNCILSGEIYRNERPNNSILLIPIKPNPGIIFVALATQPYTSLSFSKRPLSLHSFRLLLRIVELLTPLLEQIAEICKRVELQWQQTDKQNHYQLFFKEFIKTQLISSQGSSQNHLQVNQRGHQSFQIDSHRMQYPNAVIQSVFQKFQITNLMIYHLNSQNTVNEIPCVIIGEKDLAKVQRHIIGSIYLELINSGKQLLTITRNGRQFCVLPLRKEQMIIGFIHYMSKNEEKIENVAICQCLVPLILKYQGSINCKECNVKLALPQNTIQDIPKKLQQERKLNYEDSLKLVLAKDILDLQANVSQVLKSEEYLFQKLIYKLDLADQLSYFYLQEESSDLSFFSLPADEKINHNEVFIQQYSNINDCGTLGKLVRRFPNFSNLQLQIYQYQNTHPFQMIALPIKNENYLFGYILIGRFLKFQDSSIVDWLKDISHSIGLNTIFKSTNLHDEKLALELNTLSAQQQSIVHKLVEKMDKQSLSGKFFDKIHSFTSYLSTQTSLKANFSVFKLSKQQLIYRISCGKQEFRIKSFKINEQRCQILKNCDIMASHQKLYAQSCKLPSNKPNRTIRPIKIQKVYQTNIFFPKVHSQLKRSLISRVKQIFQLQGWVCTENLAFITELNSQINQNLLQGDNFYSLINLGQRKVDEWYFLLIEGSQKQLNQCVLMNKILLKSLKQIYFEIIYKSLHSMPMKEQKIDAISQLSNIISSKTNPLPFVRIFKQIFQKTKSKVERFQSTLMNIVFPQGNKTRRYLSLVNQALIQIQSQSFRLIQRYRTFGLRLLPIAQQANYRISLQLGFKFILNSIQQPCNFASFRVCARLQSLLSKLTYRKLKNSLRQISQYSNFLQANQQVKALINVQKIASIIKFIDLRENKRHFFNQIRKFQQSFEDNLTLISYQYKKLKFYCRQTFLKFINQRFNTIIRQISYSNITKIEFLCAQQISNFMIIYKISPQHTMLEFRDQQLQNSLKEKTIYQVDIPSQFGPNHSLLYKVKTKTETITQKELSTLNKVIGEGIAPCYSRYIACVLEKTGRLSQVLLQISCKEIFNGSSSESQKIYAFGRGLCLEQQCQKLRVLSKLKSLKKVYKIDQTKLLKSAINQQSKNLYNLQYEHNALSGLLSGNLKSLSEQQSKVIHKYGEVITRDCLKHMRQSLEVLQIEEQKKLLQYQIKSKTFATSKIITFLEKRESAVVEKVSYEYLAVNKQKEGLMGNEKVVEKAYVQKRLELAKVKDLIKDQEKKQQKTATRAIWLACSQLLKRLQNIRIESTFQKLFLPKRTQLAKLL